MATEIELKAWVDNIDAVRSALEREAEFLYHYKKYDCYWFAKKDSQINKLPFSGLRVRRETRVRKNEEQNNKTEEVTLITYKTKEKRDDIEVNTEEEFEVSEYSSFEKLLDRLGLERGYTKQKCGSLYRAGKINAELSNVEKLGVFIELEIISQEIDALSCGETVRDSRTTLINFLTKLGIPKSKIETRYYSEMLEMRKQ